MQAQQSKVKSQDKDESVLQNEMHVLRCPNSGCGKTHFSVGSSLMEGLNWDPVCPGCSQTGRMGHYLVYEAEGKIILRAYCSVCRKEWSSLLPGIRRICERCGWEGEFFLGFQKI